MYQPRTYRHQIKNTELISFNVTVKETDLYIRTVKNLHRNALKSAQEHRAVIEGYIRQHPAFLTALEPLDISDDAPEIIEKMAGAAESVGLGPMSAVAGAIAEAVGKDLLPYSPEIIIENGGDIFIKTEKQRLIGIYAGDSPLSNRIAITIDPQTTPLGICTSSGTVGHSLSFGKADAVVVLSPSTYLADAAATAIGNIIKEPEDIPAGIELAEGIREISGVLIIMGDRIGIWGDIQIARI